MLSTILLQAAQGAGEGGYSSMSFWIMMLLIFVVFYFFMIRPQTKRQKELQKQRESMRRGDKVITNGGIYGIIKEVQDTAFLVEVAKDVVIKIDKSSVFASVEDLQQDAAQSQKEGEKK